jgi:hypothetical protein
MPTTPVVSLELSAADAARYLKCLQSAVATGSARPDGWRDAEYAMHKAAAGMLLARLRGQRGSGGGDAPMVLEYFDWTVTQGELARYVLHLGTPGLIPDNPAAAVANLEAQAEARAAFWQVHVELARKVGDHPLIRMMREEEAAAADVDKARKALARAEARLADAGRKRERAALNRQAGQERLKRGEPVE